MRLLKIHICLIFDLVINKDERLIKSFGERLREFRLVQGLSQEKLANLANIPISQIGRIERGLNNPTLSTIGTLSTALKIPIVDFFR